MNVTLYDLIKKSRGYIGLCSFSLAGLVLFVYYTEPRRLSILDFIFKENESGQLPIVMWLTVMFFCVFWYLWMSISIMESLKKGMTADEISRCDS